MISNPTIALCVLRSTSRLLILPARTPATFMSAPLTSPNALSSTTLYFGLVGALAAGPEGEGGAAGDGEQEECRDDPPHLLPRQHLTGIAVHSAGFHGLEPSGFLCSAEPGQRLRWLSAAADSKAALRSSGGTGESWPLATTNALA